MGHDDTHAHELFVLGYSDDVRALLDHLSVEAPHALSRLVIVVPPARRAAVRAPAAVTVVEAEPMNVMALLDAGIENARVVAIFADDPNAPALVRTLRRLCPTAEVFAPTREGGAASLRGLYSPGAFDGLSTA